MLYRGDERQHSVIKIDRAAPYVPISSTDQQWLSEFKSRFRDLNRIDQEKYFALTLSVNIFNDTVINSDAEISLFLIIKNCNIFLKIVFRN